MPPAGGGGEVIRYGEITPLSAGREELASAHAGVYALFAGGEEYVSDVGSRYHDIVDAYNKDFIKISATTLSIGRQYLAGADAGSYALFAGGSTGTNYSYSDRVDAYSPTLTRSTLTALSRVKYDPVGVSVGEYGIIAGGYASSVPVNPVEVDAYNSSLVHISPANLSYYRGSGATGASVRNYALIVGGLHRSVDVYNDSLVHTYITVGTGSSESFTEAAGASTINHALIGGGRNGGTHYATIQAYNADLVNSLCTDLSVGRYELAGASTNTHALFAGGYATDAVDVYNDDLVHSVSSPLSFTRYSHTGISLGTSVLFAGGRANSSPRYTTIVEVYIIK